MAVVVFMCGVTTCTGGCAGHKPISDAITVVVGIFVVIGVVIVGREQSGGFGMSVVVLVHGVGACTGSCAGYETVSHARAVVVRFGTPGTWRNGYEGILGLRAHSRVLRKAGGLFGVVVVRCSSGHERDGGMVIVCGNFTALCGSVVGVVTTWVNWSLPWLG